MPLASMGDLIRQRRVKLDLTQEELAERVTDLGEPIRQADISRIERGLVSFPRRARLEAIATALNVPFGDLLARSEWFGPDDGEPRGDDRFQVRPQPDQRPQVVDDYPLQTARANLTGARTISHRELREIMLRAVEIEERFQRNVELVRESRRLFVEMQNRVSPDGRHHSG